MLNLLHKKCKLGGVRTWSNAKNANVICEGSLRPQLRSEGKKTKKKSEFFSNFFLGQNIYKKKKRSCLWQGSNQGPSVPHSTVLSIMPRGK